MVITLSPVYAEDYAGTTVDILAPVSIGNPVRCDSANVNQLTNDPALRDWAMENGLIEVSSITDKAALIQGKTSTMHSSQTLIIGCWHIAERLSETVGGKEKSYVRTEYRLNDLVLSSPFMKRPVCRKKTPGGVPKFNFKLHAKEAFSDWTCMEDTFNTRYDNLQALTKESLIFELKESRRTAGKWTVIQPMLF